MKQAVRFISFLVVPIAATFCSKPTGKDSKVSSDDLCVDRRVLPFAWLWETT
jgi:hypothetical protein